MQCILQDYFCISQKVHLSIELNSKVYMHLKLLYWLFQYLVSIIISFQWVFQPEEASSEEHKKALSGANAEDNVFKNMKVTFENQKVQDTVVITGWKVKGLDRRVIGESDFLIVSLPLEAIIHIEVKRSQKGSQKVETRKKNNDPTIKAAEQLERTNQMINEL